MDASLRESTMLDTCLERAGAVQVLRDGATVVSHFGSVAAEVAVCRKSVGLAVRSDLRTFELDGHQAWLESLLERQSLGANVPTVGRAARVAGSWCARLDTRRALVIGSHPAVARWERVVRQAVVSGSPLTIADGSTTRVALSLIGPRVGELAQELDLPCGEIGSVAGCSIGDDALVLREGADRLLLVVAAPRAGTTCEVLLSAGRRFGLSLVGAEAIGRLTAASHARA